LPTRGFLFFPRKSIAWGGTREECRSRRREKPSCRMIRGISTLEDETIWGLRNILGVNDILIQAENVGGRVNRTVRLDMSSGRAWVQSSRDGEMEL